MSDWLTIREAALALGISDLTVRRRIKDGRMEHTLRDGKYFVRLSTTGAPVSRNGATLTGKTQTEAEPKRSPAPSNNSSTTHSIDIDALIVKQAGLAQEAGRAAQLEEQLRALEERYTELQTGTIALATRNGWLESKLEERERDLKLLEDSRHKRSWIWRVFGGSNNGSAS